MNKVEEFYKTGIDLDNLTPSGLNVSTSNLIFDGYYYSDVDDIIVIECIFMTPDPIFPDVNLCGEYLCDNRSLPRIVASKVSDKTCVKLYFLIANGNFRLAFEAIDKIANYMHSIYTNSSLKNKVRWYKWIEDMEKKYNISNDKTESNSIEEKEFWNPAEEIGDTTSTYIEDIYEKDFKLQSSIIFTQKEIEDDLRKHATEIAKKISKSSNKYKYRDKFYELLNEELEKLNNKNK